MAVEEIIEKDKEKYIQFFNEASPVTSRYHQFELPRSKDPELTSTNLRMR